MARLIMAQMASNNFMFVSRLDLCSIHAAFNLMAKIWQSSSLFLSHVILSNKANEVLFLELPLYQYQFSFPVSLEAAQIIQLNLRQCSGIIQSLIATSSNSDAMMNCRMF